eukprot:SAG31_NODE_13_length_37961_cov_21.751307_26_plen_65_part_00
MPLNVWLLSGNMAAGLSTEAATPASAQYIFWRIRGGAASIHGLAVTKKRLSFRAATLLLLPYHF